MSDPVTNVEIEDVLSSIRRLVSEESRPPRDSNSPATERFVLSPALRVSEDETGPAPSDEPAEDRGPILLTQPSLAPGAEGAPDDEETGKALFLRDPAPRTEAADHGVEHWSESRVAEPWDDDDDSADFGPVVDDQAEMAEDVSASGEMPEDPVPEDPAEAEQIAALRASLNDTSSAWEGEIQEAPLTGAFDDWVEEGEPVLTDEEEPDGSGASDTADSALDDKIETLERMLHRQSQGWTPKDEAEQTASDESSGTGDLTAASNPEADEAHESPDTAEVIAEEAMEMAYGDDTLSSLVEATVNDFEEDTGAPDPADDRAAEGKPAFVRHASMQTLEWEDHTPGSYHELAPPADPEADATALAEIDEEALQVLVAEIVRQELKGALGERITRNVRKLVRREIHRVLMSQDLD